MAVHLSKPTMYIFKKFDTKVDVKIVKQVSLILLRSCAAEYI